LETKPKSGEKLKSHLLNGFYTLEVNFINILQSAFCKYFFAKKMQAQIVRIESLFKHFLTKKCSKMLLKLTSYILKTLEQQITICGVGFSDCFCCHLLQKTGVLLSFVCQIYDNNKMEFFSLSSLLSFRFFLSFWCLFLSV